MKRRKVLLPIPVEPPLKGLIKRAAHRTNLSQADVLRSALRLGVPQLLKRLKTTKPPRRNFADYVGLFSDITNTAEDAALYFDRAIASKFRFMNVVY